MINGETFYFGSIILIAAILIIFQLLVEDETLHVKAVKKESTNEDLGIARNYISRF